MKIETIYINTHKFDFNFAKICISSIRFWYPSIPIKLIKDYGSGNFDTSKVEKMWNVGVLDLARKTLGWGYGKLEPLFLNKSHCFLILDSDTVILGPVLESIAKTDAKFVVDEETLPAKRVNEIYYNLDRVAELAPGFKYPGYSFNSGQWFGTSGVLSRKDFERSLKWSDPPRPLYPEIVFNGDQSHLNFVLHLKEQFEALPVLRQKIMIWPAHGKADFLELEKISRKASDFPYIMHWAGIKFKKMDELPRADILRFYADLYYNKMGKIEWYRDNITNYITPIRKKWKHFVASKL